MNTIVLYKIQSIKMPNRLYIGSTKNFALRETLHLGLLRKGKHTSRKLQDHYDEFGEEDLQFLIIIGCERDQLLDSEMFFIKACLPYFNTVGIRCTIPKKKSKKRMKEKILYPKLKEALPFGTLAKAARKFGITDSAVSQIASGKTENREVLDYLLKRARDYQKYLNKVRAEIQGYGLKKEMEAL